MINPKRIRQLNQQTMESGPVVYWMSRDQRVSDNWALNYAYVLAQRQHQPLLVVFNLVPQFLGATIRHYGFMLKGLQEVEANLKTLHIPFILLVGDPVKEIPQFLKKYNVSALVADFNPLRISQHWKKAIAAQIDIPFYEVDAHNIVPCWLASPKLEYGAYTIRPKIYKVLAEYLIDFPVLKKQNLSWNEDVSNVNWNQLPQQLKIDHCVTEVDWIKPGEKAARQALKHFIQHRLQHYAEQRNDPNVDAQSNLSPYFHFGHLAPQRAAWEVQKVREHLKAREVFLEELIIRRELADNFCLYQPHYDAFEGFPVWAQKTLNDHRLDQREYVYTQDQWEQAQTHDALWNAAQREMVVTGKMHGYMRMYWAKKILEWSDSPETALKTALYLNDKYELDGLDPNGYVGVAWSIGGVHDRAWFERSIYGKIRYMNANGCAAKFDVEAYIKKNQKI